MGIKDRRNLNTERYLVYVLCCSDGSLYTGITNNIEKRLQEHVKKKVKYTRSRLPVSLRYVEAYNTKSEALKRELGIKKMSHKEKEELIELPDIQNTQDDKGKSIERVGVKDVRIPLYILRQPKEKEDKLPNVVDASVNAYVDVASEVRGVNMSRFLEVIVEFSNGTLNSDMLGEILTAIKNRLKSRDAYIQIRFPYFVMKTSPRSKLQAPMAYYVTFIGRLVNNVCEFAIQVEVYVTNCCPCSKEIAAGQGAHNQRALVTLKIIPDEKKLWWIEDIITFLEAEGSCEIFPLLKRHDEKWVTIKAYNNPKFVEDLVRDVAVSLDKKNIDQYYVKVEAEESIHVHNAVAYITKDWKLG